MLKKEEIKGAVLEACKNLDENFRYVCEEQLLHSGTNR